MRSGGLLVVLVGLLVACGSEAPTGARCEIGRAQSCACAGGATGAQECSPAGVWSVCSCAAPVDAGGDAVQLDGTAVDVGADASPAADVDVAVVVDAPPDAAQLDAAPDGVQLDASADAPSVPADIGPPPMLTEERATRSVRVALRVEGLTPGAPAAVYLEARNVRYTNAGTGSPSIAFDACGPSGCLRGCGVASFNARMEPADFGCPLAPGVMLSATATVLSSPVYTRPIASGAERVQNFVARVAAPATSTHGALVGVEGATASAMVGEVWLMGAPAAL